tara:strand:- start:233 stop:364 length:132 start_codon:yes stop_codon:yes gene_type:complete
MRYKVAIEQEKVKTKRPGVHSKNNNSKVKTSKSYKKRYRGQGR